MNITRTRAITEPVQTGNHPMNVKNSILKNDDTGIVTTAVFPLVAINTAIRIPMVTIKDEIIPACEVEVFMKSATF